jgi:hypothetical protein
MLRITMMLLCVILAAAAFGRYKAEVSVREARRELKAIEDAKARELSEIRMLRAEVAFLERPERLAKIAARYTDLHPLTGAQLATAEEFIAAVSAKPETKNEANRMEEDIIGRVLTVADAGPYSNRLAE